MANFAGKAVATPVSSARGAAAVPITICHHKYPNLQDPIAYLGVEVLDSDAVRGGGWKGCRVLPESVPRRSRSGSATQAHKDTL